MIKTTANLQKELTDAWDRLPREVKVPLQLRAQQVLIGLAPETVQYDSGLRYCIDMAKNQMARLERMRREANAL